MYSPSGADREFQNDPEPETGFSFTCKNVEVKIGTPQYTQEKFELYLIHKERFSSQQDDVEDEQNFRLSFYVNTPFGIEFEYYLDGKLIGVALGDKTAQSFSAIYTFYQVP